MKRLIRTKHFCREFKWPLILIYLFMCHQTVWALESMTNSSIIFGHIFDARSSHSIQGATIWLEPPLLGANSDSLGFFEIKNVPNGKYRLISRSIFYRPMQKEILISSNEDSIHVEIAMEPTDTILHPYYSLQLNSSLQAIQLADSLCMEKTFVLLTSNPEKIRISIDHFKWLIVKLDTLTPIDYQSVFNTQVKKYITKKYGTKSVKELEEMLK